VVDEAEAPDDAVRPVRGQRLFGENGELLGTYFPIAHGTPHRANTGGATDPDVACRSTPGSVYCNSLSPGWWQPPFDDPAEVIGDDLSLAAVAGCELDRYVLTVNGNVDGSGTGPYTVMAALYPSCPGAGDAAPIPGTACSVTLPDENPARVVCEAPPGTILPTSNLWVGVQFSRLGCGIAVGAPATKGFSADVLDFPGFACNARLGGFLPGGDGGFYGKHASFFLEVYTRGECADPSSDPPTEAFPNHKNSNHAGLSFAPGGNVFFADDVSLEVPECFMTRLEIAVKGNGVTMIDLRTALSDVDPVNEGVIPFDSIFFVIGEPTVKIAHRDFDPPILLPQSDLWVGYRTTSAITGPIIVDKPADLGQNNNVIFVHDGTHWTAGPLGETDSRYAATDVIIHCAGTPPTGACCDMALTENRVCVGGDNHNQPCTDTIDCPGGTCIGDSVCRDDLPQMNCATGHLPHLWSRDAACEGVCVGGTNDDNVCRQQVDCPGSICQGGPDDGNACLSDDDCGLADCVPATCDGPFFRSCGLSACCTAADECFNLTEKECFRQPPIDDPHQRMYQYGEYCGIGGQRCADCFFYSDWPCDIPHPGPGCDDNFCCCEVCRVDAFCCFVQWDETCVDLAREVGCFELAPNDECAAPRDAGALLLTVPDSVVAEVDEATRSPYDPGFCCHTEEPGAPGLGTVWFRFIGPQPPTTQEQHSSVRIDTCLTNSMYGYDSLIEAFLPADPDPGICDDGSMCSVLAQDCADGSTCVTIVTDETACGNLVAIACNDDVGPNQDCPREHNSRLCVPDVVPGYPYYILVAAKDRDNIDSYRLELTQGCTADPPIPNDACDDGQLIEGGLTEPLAILFDLSGGSDYAQATFDCLMPPHVLPNMQNDIWYDWVVPADGNARIQTCDPALPPEQQPNTTMIVYEGCDCPVSSDRAIAWNDYCGFECHYSSCVDLDVTGGQCYKIRLGGHLARTPAGTLSIELLSPQADCNGNGVPDDQDLADGTSFDCNTNDVPDECDIAAGTAPDQNENTVPDECDECVADSHCDDELYCNGAESCDVDRCVPGPDPCPVACDETSDKCLPRLRDHVIGTERKRP
jgi:hypothetical protein